MARVLLVNKLLANSTVVAFCLAGFSADRAHAQSAGARSSGAYVCDIAYEDCREEVLTLIKNEKVGIDPHSTA